MEGEESSDETVACFAGFADCIVVTVWSRHEVVQDMFRVVVEEKCLEGDEVGVAYKTTNVVHEYK